MIKSVLAQTFQDWELVLLDDGSTDDSLTIARSVADPRIRVFSNGRNLGRAASLNKLTRLARGAYIARMDSDDMCAPTRIEKQVAHLQRHSDVDVVGTGLLFVDQGARPMGHWLAVRSHAEICKEPLRTFWMAHGSILARRAWLQRFEYDESLSLAVDANLFLRAYEHSTFDNVPEALYYYRFEPSFRLNKQLATRRIVARYLFERCRASGRLDQAVWHWGLQYAKFAVTAAMFTLGLRKRLLARRFSPLSAEEEAAYSRCIETIRGVRLTAARDIGNG